MTRRAPGLDRGTVPPSPTPTRSPGDPAQTHADVVRHELTTAHVFEVCLTRQRAGVSEAAGFPTFSSAKDFLEQIGIQHAKGTTLKRIFDVLKATQQTPESFSLLLEVAEKFRAISNAARPTPFHKLLQTLDARNQLLRVYTQNIDGLEVKAKLSLGLPILEESFENTETDSEEGRLIISPMTSIARCIPLHGTCKTMRCDVCRHLYPLQSLLSPKGLLYLPQCPACKEKSDERRARGQRALRIATLRPSIVLYNEPHPDGQTIAEIISHDTHELSSSAPCILVVAGTGLDIPGTRSLVKEMAAVIKRKNWTNIFDAWVEGDVQEFSQLVGRSLENKLICNEAI
ncbi:DHS-like NAD/FAD-binding domain-containing protein [Mycena vitilis]|nr:DHS-like NAD/FAD-binding domain-containing protein [Mycena vitilis]